MFVWLLKNICLIFLNDLKCLKKDGNIWVFILGFVSIMNMIIACYLIQLRSFVKL